MTSPSLKQGGSSKSNKIVVWDERKVSEKTNWREKKTEFLIQKPELTHGKCLMICKNRIVVWDESENTAGGWRWCEYVSIKRWAAIPQTYWLWRFI